MLSDLISRSDVRVFWDTFIAAILLAGDVCTFDSAIGEARRLRAQAYAAERKAEEERG